MEWMKILQWRPSQLSGIFWLGRGEAWVPPSALIKIVHEIGSSRGFVAKCSDTKSHIRPKFIQFWGIIPEPLSTKLTKESASRFPGKGGDVNGKSRTERAKGGGKNGTGMGKGR